MITDPNALDVMIKLKKLHLQISELMQLIGDNKSFSASTLDELRQRFSILKGSLKSESARWSTVRGQQTLNQYESEYLVPAVREAMGHLNAASNTHPINSDWLSELGSAEIDITYYLDQLESNDRE